MIMALAPFASLSTGVGDASQSIEEEVRMHLHLEYLQFGASAC
jgi:hypothetical protein